LAGRITIIINTTVTQYLNADIDHTLATLSGIYAPINSLALVPINPTTSAYIKINDYGALILNLTNALNAGRSICVHVEFLAK